MQRTLVIVSAVALAAAGASFAACSSDDSNNNPGVDSGLADTSTPVEDSNVPVVDSNVPVQDSNVPPEDSNAPPPEDAGSDAKSPVDAGQHDASDAGSVPDASDAQTAVDASDASSAADANDASSPTDASDAGEDASDGGVTLNIINYKNWCTLSVNGVLLQQTATPSTVVAPGSTATIVATPKLLADGGSLFIIGPDPWFGTNENDGGAAPGVDEDAGVNESSTVQVTIGSGPTQCVQVCCQFPTNTPACPTTNTCQ